MESRSRRSNAGKRSSNGADALEKLKAARDGRAKRSDQHDVADEADAFVEVDEEEYKAMVQQRRSDNFVEDDGENEAAAGYVDYGEEVDWTASHYGEDDIAEEQQDKSSKRKADKGDPAAKRSKAPPKPIVAVSNFFRGGKDINSVNKKQKNVVTMEADDLLQSMLGDIACETGIAVESAPVLRTKSSQNKPPVPSKKPKKFDAFAYSAPPPQAASLMVFDDEEAQNKTDEEAKLDEEIQELERQSKIAALKKKKEALARGEQPEEPAAVDIGSPGANGLSPGGSQPSPPSATQPTPRSSNTPAGAQSTEMAGITPKLHKKSVTVDASFWDHAENETQAASAGVTSGTAVLPERNEDGSIDFYWFDAVEDQYAFPGTVYLFGKVRNQNTHSSCCVEVKGNLRCMYLLPRRYAMEEDMETETDHEVTFEDVAKEISQICSRNRVNKIQSCRVFREYAFEKPGVPTEKTEYLKVVYPFTSPQLKDVTCGQTFSHIFGTNTGCLENFLLRRKLAGPSWLKLHRIQDNPTQNSWCQFGAVVTDPKSQISVVQNPPAPPELKVMSVRFRTVQSHGSQGDEIVMASAIIHNQVNIENATESPRFSHFTIVRKLADRPFPHDLAATVKSNKRNIDLCSSEHALLQLFVSKLHRCDPDVIVGHAINSVDIEVLLKRMDAKKTSNWSRLGRLRRSKMPQLKSSMIESVKRQATAGRLVCDTWMTSKELVRQKNYSLVHLAQVVLDTQHQAVDMDDIPSFYRASRELLQLADHCTREAHLVLSLMFKLQVLPLTKQLTNLAGNLWQKSLFSQRAERIEYLLLHEFHNLKYIVPDKAGYKKKAVADADAVSDNAWRKRKKPAYAGGLVLEPKRGFYDKCVLLLDFNSLYPSIIQEYNICFTTVEYDKQSAEPTGVEEMEIPEAPPSTAQKGILPRLIKTLVDRRRQVKQLLKTEKDPAKYKQLDIRQLALKIMANSMYGCLGFTYSRFYAKPLAALVTYKGRDILQNTMDLAQQKLNKEVIYGDTDSIMVYTGTDDLKEVKKIGNDIKAEVNKMYKLLEIEIDGIMQSMLLLNKKKYAALMITENKDGTLTTTKETKGLDLVRRDWCELSQDAGNYVLDQILSGTSSDEVVSSIHEHMRTVAAHVRGNKVPLNKYIIHKSLTKPPDAYPDAKGLPHVQVAKQLQKRGEAVTVGMHIQYVICKGEENTNFAARAYHPDQILRAEGLLEVDTEWYLSNQIHPPICRLLSPIDGTDSSQLAECLGLDASKFRQIRTNEDDEDDVHKGVAMDDAERFRECTPFQLTCPHPSCGVQFEPANIEWSKRLQCPSCNLTLPTCYIQNSLTLAIRNTIATYQDGWMACEEPTCQHRTRQVCFGSYIHGGASLATTSEVGRQCLSLGCRGRVTREITDRKLYLQLLFLQSIYDVRRADTAMDRKARGKLDDGEHLSPKMRRNNTMPHFDTITEHVKSYLKQSAFNMVSLSNLFNPVMQSRNSTLDIKAEVSKIYKLAK